MPTLNMVRRWVVSLHAVSALAAGQPSGYVPSTDLDLYKMSFVMNEGADAEQRQAACKALFDKARATAPDDGAGATLAVSGILEQAVDTMRRYIAEEGTFTQCADAIGAAVVFKPVATEYLNTHTNAIETLVQGINMYESSPRTLRKLAPHVAGYTTTLSHKYGERVERAGGFDALFRILARYPANPHVQLASWRGLSDHAHTPRGAAILAHHGGPLSGCRYLIEELRRSPAYQPNPSDLTLKYQILQNIHGLLSNDSPDGRYLAAFTENNLPQVLAETLHWETDRRSTQDVGCRVMLNLLQRQPLTAPLYEEYNGIAMFALSAFARPTVMTASVSGTATDSLFPVAPAAQRVVQEIARIREQAAMSQPATDLTSGM